MITAAEQRAWLDAHASKLRARIDKLTDARSARTAEGRKERAMETDKLERRLSRLLRAAAGLDASVEREKQRARRLLKSKKPRDQAEALVAAVDELPADLALAVANELIKRARARTGGAP